jgi:hypothetical protein
VVVTVGAVRMVQMATHQVVNVLAVRYGVVSASRAMLVRRLVLGTCVTWGAFSRVRAAGRQRMLVDMIAVDIVQLSIMNVIGVALVLNRLMATVRSVSVTCTPSNSDRGLLRADEVSE